jgi:YVTN family beta-propeller protein
MPRGRCALLLLVVLNCGLSQPAAAQTLLANIPAGTWPVAVAVNPTTERIFVVNQGSNNVTEIYGPDNEWGTVNVGVSPCAVAVNQATNKIYVANSGDNTATVIDGTTFSTTTIPTGTAPVAIAVNPVTNRIYVANQYSNNVTVIDGYSNSVIATVPVVLRPQVLAVNPVTNKIYVALGEDWVTVINGVNNSTGWVYTGGSDPYAVDINLLTNRIYVANFRNTVSVIDGASDTLMTNVPIVDKNGAYPYLTAIAVNPVSNKIYVAGVNSGDGTVSVIDGTSNTATPVAVAGSPSALAVAAATNKIYVTDSYHYLVMIDGVDDSVAGSVFVGDAPEAVALNPASNTIYVANYYSNNVAVVTGGSSDPLQFIPLTPCRVVDTRLAQGPFGGPSLSGGTSRDFVLPLSPDCPIPSSALAYSLNVTVVPHGPLNYLTVWPTGESLPYVSTLNSGDGRVKANADIVPAGAGGAISVFTTNTADVILDINGYFDSPSANRALAFFPLAPCRVIDTRIGQGGTTLQGMTEYDYQIQGICGIPSNAQAYSFNFTVVPVGAVPVGYLTVWPYGQSLPTISTLNDYTGTVVANAGIVPAGIGGEISAWAYTTGKTDLLVDVNGYFAPANSGMSSPLSLYTVTPCRVLDTRWSHGAFSGTLNPPVNFPAAPCGVPSVAQAFVMNATVVPLGSVGYLTLWPDGAPQPLVSTLNAYDGAVTSNMAIVPTTNGLIDAYASNWTHLILDSFAYFGP